MALANSYDLTNAELMRTRVRGQVIRNEREAYDYASYLEAEIEELRHRQPRLGVGVNAQSFQVMQQAAPLVPSNKKLLIL